METGQKLSNGEFQSQQNTTAHFIFAKKHLEIINIRLFLSACLIRCDLFFAYFHTYMIQIINYILIFNNDNQSKYKISLNCDFE